MQQHLKQLMMTLALLLTAAMGAWAADVLNIVVNGTSATIMYDGNASNNPILGEFGWEQGELAWDMDYTTRSTITTVTIDGSCKNFSGTSLHSLFNRFSGLTTINGLDNLNTVGVQDMQYMFACCSSLTSLDLSSVKTASVTTMFSMFDGCSKLTSLDLSSWNTEKVEKTNSLFADCSELTTVDLSSWNTAKVMKTNYMFGNCSKLENIYVGDGWSTAAVTSSGNMFKGCTKLPGYDANKIDHAMAKLVPEGYLQKKPEGIEVAWNETDKAWEFEMPEEGDVELEIAYKTVSQMTVTFDGEAIAAEGVTGYLRQESAFVSALAAAVTGVDDATFTVESSDATVIAFGESNAATGALADVKFLKEGQATLTVTFAGNDDYGRASQTIAVTVTEMTYDVALKEGAAHADQWQLKAGDGDFQVLQQPVTGVKATTKMKLKFTGDKSLLKGVKAKLKKPAATVKTITIAADFHTSGEIATAPEITIEYNEGEKWSDVAARYDWLKMYETYTVYYDADSKRGDLHTADGGVIPSDLVDPTKSYYWGFE